MFTNSIADSAPGPRPCGDPPPLRIHHLLACTAVAALRVTVWRQTMPSEHLDVWLSQPHHSAIAAIGLAAQGVGFTFAIFSVYWYFKGHAVFSQPGQWVLLSYFFSMTFELLSPYLHQLLVSLGFTWTGIPWQRNILVWTANDFISAIIQSLLFTLNTLVPIAFFIWCAWRIANSWPWRLVFISSSMLDLVSLVSLVITPLGIGSPFILLDSANTIYLVLQAPVLCFTTTAIIHDVVARCPLSWTHWVGALLLVIDGLLLLAIVMVDFFSA
jgi:hypothetical protein